MSGTGGRVTLSGIWDAAALIVASVVAALAIALVGAPAAGAEGVSTNFNYTGAEQAFTVPAGVTTVHVVATGAAGNTRVPEAGAAVGGRGAVVSGDLSVTPGATLYVEVGGPGHIAETLEEPQGGFNGGGNGVGGGGGASDVRTTMRSEPNTLASRLLVAAGGGGGGGKNAGGLGGFGGDAGAGGAQGEDGGVEGGNGGGAATEIAGGLGGGENQLVEAGSLGAGGAGFEGGGGGGGGLYGGGSGGPHTYGHSYEGGFHAVTGGAGGGGGGSNLVPKGGTAALDENGAAPQITITYATDPPPAPAPGHGCGRDHSRRDSGRQGQGDRGRRSDRL